MLKKFIVLLITLINLPATGQKPDLQFRNMDGFKGIWFELGQKFEYGDKYSGGLGTYTAKHRPLAIYSEDQKRTYFVYGGTSHPARRHLLCMISYYDHETNKLAGPVVVHDKQGVNDPHDNPSLLIDHEGYIWVFVSGRGRARPGFKYKSYQPYRIDSFIHVSTEEMTYPQPWLLKEGYFHFFTKYTGIRELYYETSRDGNNWTSDIILASIKKENEENAGHYQISGSFENKVGTFFNWHPNGNVDKRTNLYYMESNDFGRSWQSVDGKKLDIPVTQLNNPGMVGEYYSKKKNVYLKDMNYDQEGNPVALYLVSDGPEPGPVNGERTWKIAYWSDTHWDINDVCTSDHNYDMGSLYISENSWLIVAPSAPGPQKWGTGGEIEIWESQDQGKNWKKIKEVTEDSEYNHTYIRRPINANEEFYAFWADGDPYNFSRSRLYFMDKDGRYQVMPYDHQSLPE